MINDAEGYRNNLVPKSRGEAAQIINEAKAYAKEKVLVALGETERFNMVYEEYRKSKDITRERILLETMASILPKVNKVIADKEVGGNVLPFLPLVNCVKFSVLILLGMDMNLSLISPNWYIVIKQSTPEKNPEICVIKF